MKSPRRRTELELRQAERELEPFRQVVQRNGDGPILWEQSNKIGTKDSFMEEKIELKRCVGTNLWDPKEFGQQKYIYSTNK